MADEVVKKADKEENLPGNSYTKISPKTSEPKKGEKDRKGRVTEKKKTVGERIADNFLATDGEEIREHVLFDFLIPGIKTIIEDIVHMILFGGKGDSRISRDRGESRPRYVEYNRSFDDKRKRSDEFVSRRGSRHPELIFTRRSDAEQVMSGMLEYIEDYGRATLKDFYNVVFEVSEGEIDIPTDYTMTRYGWYDLKAARVTHVREGYLLQMPKTEVIGR